MVYNHFFNKVALFLFSIIAYNTVLAQKPDSLLNELNTKYPEEKIYLQYDRPYYNPGETIWFKAYITSANTASTISKTVYAELLDEKGAVLQKKIMPVIESGAASYFDLPDSLHSSVLYVRAYTSWMLNFDSTLLYLKPITVINNGQKKNTIAPSYTLTFFPEGGDLVNGIQSRVAFKAVDQSGNPIPVSGNIVDKSNNKLIGFTSTHNGMGAFPFTPDAGENYKAIWKDKKGTAHETALPASKAAGVVLGVANINNRITYNLQRPGDVSESFKSYYVVAEMQQQVIYSATVNMQTKTSVTAPLPVDSLANGIVQLTVFNADMLPVAERIFFIKNDNYYFNTDLHAVELNLNSRKHNTLQVDVGGRIVSNLSISVTDESLSTPAESSDNIFSSLLLTSDLKGYVYNPAWYFSSDEDSVARQLDLVMLTNGWRRYKWEDILAKKTPQSIYQAENYLTISGNVYGISGSVLKGKQVSVILNTKSGADNIFTIPVNTDGRFSINGIYFFDTAKVYYQFNNDKDKQLTSISTFTFNNSFVKPSALSSSVLNTFYSPAQPDSLIAAKNKQVIKLVQQQFFEGNKSKLLNAVVLKSQVKTPEQKLDEKYTSGFFTGGDGISFNIANDPVSRVAVTVLDYLKGRVAGLEISTSGGTASATWRGSNTSVYLNESASDFQMVQGISMTDVALIKVFRPIFFNSTGNGAGGAIAVYMKKGEKGQSSFKALDFARVNGFSSVKEFYSPDYNKATTVIPENDVRSTLYWNPFIIMDNITRRIKIPFFNSDSCKKIRVVIEGLNSLGQLTREEKVFE